MQIVKTAESTEAGNPALHLTVSNGRVLLTASVADITVFEINMTDHEWLKFVTGTVDLEQFMLANGAEVRPLGVPHGGHR